MTFPWTERCNAFHVCLIDRPAFMGAHGPAVAHVRMRSVLAPS